MASRTVIVVAVIAIVVAACSLALAAQTYYETFMLSTKLESLKESLRALTSEVSITIDYGNGTTRTHKLLVPIGYTALDALRCVAKVETRLYSWGEYIVAIDDVHESMEKNLFWLWYIMGEKGEWVLAPVGAGAYVLKSGDHVKFSYEKPPW
ncbi:MAG: DUF4430 domain-containing protein [Candidatus Nezhaarchaeota archaeon]|nr:DUF4430 domain-containing protein [Candidatus Nezhaarchaeota archaeon]